MMMILWKKVQNQITPTASRFVTFGRDFVGRLITRGFR